MPSPISRRSVIAAGLAASGCRVLPSDHAGTFKLGLVAPFSGRDFLVGYNIIAAVKQAITAVNEAGGLAPGWKIELVAHDDRNDAVWGRLQARKMAVDPDVVAVIGHPSNESAEAARPIYAEAGIPLVTLASLDSLTRGPGVWRAGVSDSVLAAFLALELPARFNARRVALVSSTPADGKLTEALAALWWARVGEVSFGDGIQPMTTNFEPFALRIVASAPQAVVYSGGIELGGPLYAEIRRLAPGLPFVVSPAALSPHLIRLSGSPPDFLYAVSPAPDPADVPWAADFVKTYRTTGADPLPQAAIAFDATQLAIAAASIGARPSRASMMAALPDAAAGSGLSGTNRFTPQNERQGAAPVLYRLVGQRFPGERVA